MVLPARSMLHIGIRVSAGLISGHYNFLPSMEWFAQSSRDGRLSFLISYWRTLALTGRMGSRPRGPTWYGSGLCSTSKCRFNLSLPAAPRWNCDGSAKSDGVLALKILAMPISRDSCYR